MCVYSYKYLIKNLSMYYLIVNIYKYRHRASYTL